MTDRLVHLTIDGREVTCPEGDTIYRAASAAGIHIPTFCNHEKLVPVGACRMCLVEIEGARGLQTSCTTPAREDMVVKVHTSPAAVKARKANIEFLLTNHPLDCPVCDKGGECPLQDQALLDGPGQSRYIEEKRHKSKRHPLGELIVVDQERCVLCWRCIRFLDEWADDHELDLFGRGATTRLETFPDRPLRSKWQGNTIDICPVGALTSRVFRFEARVWELTDTPSVCPLCGVGCNIVLGVKNNKLRRITPRENMEVNDAWICDKGRFGHACVDDPGRLTTPLIRREGQLQPASWDEALDLVAQRLDEIGRDQRAQAIAGLGSTRATNEANYLFQRFMRGVAGTNSVDHLYRMPTGATPLTSLPELENRDLILLLGCDPSNEAPLVELWIKKAVLRHGATVLVANPRRIELARYGEGWLGYRPGTEVSLLQGLAHAVLEAGLEDRTAQSARTRVTNLEEFRAWLEPFSAQEVARTTGARVETLGQAAQALVQAQQPILLYGPTWAQGAKADTLESLANLALLLGGAETAFVAPDSNTLGALEMGVVPDLYPGGQPFDEPKTRSRLASLWGGRLSPLPGLDFEGMMAAALEGSLGALWVMCADPARGADPACEGRRASQALGQVPFLVVQDLHLTETASLAKVVLPAASFAETDGSLINMTGRWQALRAVQRPPGQARPDWWIIAELAKRLVDQKERTAWELSGPADALSEISRIVPRYRGLSYAAMGEGGWQRLAPSPPARRVFIHVEAGTPIRDADYPLALVIGTRLYDWGVLPKPSQRLQRLVPDAYVMLHPGDAEKAGLSDGDDVRVVSPQGQVGLVLRIGDDVVPGVAFAPENLGDDSLRLLSAEAGRPTWVRVEK